MSLIQQIRLLRYLVATKVLTPSGPDTFLGNPAKNPVQTKRYRLTADVTRDVDGQTITAINWTWQSQDTGLPPRRKAARQGALHA